MVHTLDHGLLNAPLTRRGNIDAQIDRYKADEARKRHAAETAASHEIRAKKLEVRQLLDLMSDERVLRLARPLGKRKVSTAREALASAASHNLDVWIRALAKEVGCCGDTPCSRLDGPCYDMAGRCAKCRTRYSDGGCGCTAEEWMGA